MRALSLRSLRNPSAAWFRHFVASEHARRSRRCSSSKVVFMGFVLTWVLLNGTQGMIDMDLSIVNGIALQSRSQLA